jgi:hypothetical protein
MSQMTRTQKGHCWHPTGICLTQGLYGGSDEMVCCFCGVGGQQAWHIEMQSHKDHGPFWQVDVRVTDAVTTRVEECADGR